ncbi:hypothetical protein ABLO26_09210 [Neobacillus sp. 179-J 1A1 HS]|uniref:hypothetical protein n=1 Tax=Neobacillus driksii TaxID=3035913 RepID=UPI0035BC8475
MNNVNELFRDRVGIAQDKKITFEYLDTVLEKTAKTIPFENLCIIEKRMKEVTKDNLTSKYFIKTRAVCVTNLIQFFTFSYPKMALTPP